MRAIREESIESEAICSSAMVRLTPLIQVDCPSRPSGTNPSTVKAVFALVYVKKLDFQLFYQHGWDSAYFGTSTPGNHGRFHPERQPPRGTADL